MHLIFRGVAFVQFHENDYFSTISANSWRASWVILIHFSLQISF